MVVGVIFNLLCCDVHWCWGSNQKKSCKPINWVLNLLTLLPF